MSEDDVRPEPTVEPATDVSAPAPDEPASSPVDAEPVDAGPVDAGPGVLTGNNQAANAPTPPSEIPASGWTDDTQPTPGETVDDAAADGAEVEGSVDPAPASARVERVERGERDRRPRPSARPGGGRPGPGRSGRPGSAAATAHTPIAVEPVIEPIDPHKWGRIDDGGVVYVYSTAGERPVGNWQAGDVEAGLAHYGRRYDDFVTEISLLETRLAAGSGDPKATRAHALELRETVDTLAAVGDLDSAAARLEVVIGAAEAAMAGASQARVAARARAVAAKEALCAEAETLAESNQWKTTGDRLKEIVEQWRTIHGIDRKVDDALWKRFAKARDTFTKRRGTHFADLDKQRGAAREAKEKLIARAEALSESGEWGKTAGEFRQLMEEWKASGRAPREVEDQLWERFRAAQEKFFSRRNATFNQRDAEFDANAAAKEKLLAEAERIDPGKGMDAARAALRSIQERWEAAGKVPRERIREFDSRLRAVEDRVKRAEDSQWRRTDPETAARIEQFRSRAEQFRAQATKARAAGDERRATQAESQAKQWEEWLSTAEGATR